MASSRCFTHCSLASTIYINGKCSFQIICLRITSIHIMGILIQCYLKRISELRYINKIDSHTHSTSLHSYPNLKPWSLSNNMYSFYSTIPQILLYFSHLILIRLNYSMVVKNLPASAGDIRDMGPIPGLGRCSAEGNGNPLQYSCLENSMDRGTWWVIVYSVAKSQTRLKDCVLVHAHTRKS